MKQKKKKELKELSTVLFLKYFGELCVWLIMVMFLLGFCIPTLISLADTGLVILGIFVLFLFTFCLVIRIYLIWNKKGVI